MAVDFDSDDKRLIAYVVLHDDSTLQPEALRSILRDELPAHLIPANIVSLSRFPLTPNNKVDRAALATLGMKHKRETEQVEIPATYAQNMVADIWRDLLNIDQVGVNENFFDLGGHSLLAIRLTSQRFPPAFWHRNSPRCAV